MVGRGIHMCHVSPDGDAVPFPDERPIHKASVPRVVLHDNLEKEELEKERIRGMYTKNGG